MTLAGDVLHWPCGFLQNRKVLTTCNATAHGKRMYHEHNMLVRVALHPNMSSKVDAPVEV